MSKAGKEWCSLSILVEMEKNVNFGRIFLQGLFTCADFDP